MSGLLDTVLIGGTLAVFCIIVATLVLAAIGIWIIEAAETYVRTGKRWLRERVRRFFVPTRTSRVVATGGTA